MTNRLAGAAGLAAAATLAAAAAAAPAPASAAVLGVQDDVLSTSPIEVLEPRLNLVRSSGAKVTRVDVLWSLVETRRPLRPGDPDDPAYNWDRVDLIVRGLERRGIVPVVTVYSAPPWATGGRGAPEDREVNPHAPDPLQFARFMKAFATRYAGDHVPPGAARPLPPVDHIEIWNEPNLQGFLGPQFSGGARVGLQRYTSMVNASYTRIKAANRHAVVIAGVGGPRSTTSATGVSALEWLRAVARRTRFDAYSQHVYPAAPPRRSTPAVPSWSTVQTLIDELDRVPRHRGKPLYITEAGYTTAATPFRQVQVTPAQQAAYLRQIMALPVVRSPRVPLVVWFNLEDNRFWPGGLLREGGRRKPSWNVFVPLARASRVPAELRRATARAGAGAVTATARQLLINQRISQAAVRRSNAVQAYLDGGLTGADIRPGALGRRALAPDVVLSGTPSGTAAPPLGRARLRTAPAGPRGDAADIRVSAAQVLINQRISQAAVRRSNALTERLDGRLSGGDVRDGSVDAGAIDAGLTVVSATPSGAAQQPSRTRIAPASRSGGRVAVSATQLRINQRIAQAAVRRSNALLDVLADGLTEANFRADAIAAIDVAASARGGAPTT